MAGMMKEKRDLGMHTMFYSRLGLLFGCLIFLLAGCQSTPPVRHPVTKQPLVKPAPTPAPPDLIWPDNGELNFSLACADCASFQLSLTRDHLFRWQRLGAGQQQDDLGRWQRQGNTLQLLGQGSKALQLTLTGDNRLSFQQHALQANDHSLFSDSAVILSELIRKDDALRLAPCRTQQSWPLVNNGQYRLLLRLYEKSLREDSGVRRVLARLHWTDDRQSLTMDRFLSLGPGQCISP